MKQFYFKFEKKTFFTLFLGMFLLQGINAATITSNAVTANWSTNTTWVGNVTPTAGDNVIIASGATITINFADLTMDAGTTITVNAGGTLKTTNATYISTFDNLFVDGTFTNAGIVTIRQLLDGTGTFDNSASASVLNFAGSTINVATINVGTSSSTINYNGGNQTIKNLTTYRKLITSGTGTKTWTITASTTVQGLTLNSGAPLNISSGTGNYSFTLGTTGSTISDALTFDTSYSGNRNIYKLTINSNGSLIDLHPTGGTFSVPSGNSIINNGIVKVNSIALNAPTPPTATLPSVPTNINNSGTITCNAFGTSGSLTGTFINSATGILNFNGATIETSPFTLVTTDPGNTVNYGKAGNQIVRQQAYSNLTLSGSGEKTIGTPASTSLSTGTLSISGTATANITNTGVSVDKLILGGVGQSAGTYGFTGSGASNINNVYFSTGTGYLNVQNTLGVASFSANEMKLYPNPSIGGKFTISLPSMQQDSNVLILNLAGETLYKTTIPAGEISSINPNLALATGIYLVKMEQAGNSITKKLIIQ